MAQVVQDVITEILPQFANNGPQSKAATALLQSMKNCTVWQILNQYKLFVGILPAQINPTTGLSPYHALVASQVEEAQHAARGEKRAYEALLCGLADHGYLVRRNTAADYLLFERAPMLRRPKGAPVPRSGAVATNTPAP